MAILILTVFLIILRLTALKLKSSKIYYLICYLGATVPLLLLTIEVIPQGIISIAIAGFSLFYFAILSGRNDKDKR